MRKLLLLGISLAMATSFAAPAAGRLKGGMPTVAQDTRIGIFDLAAIHGLPLDAQVQNRTEVDGVVTEEIRYTVMPGIRAFAYLSYPTGASALACNVEIRNFGAETRSAEAKDGFVGFSVAAPSGNLDQNKKDTYGGAKATEAFTDDPQKSWVYQHVVAQIRGLDYLATRPEVDMKRVVVSGFSWSGFIAALMHALDNRPACYCTWNSTGYFADLKGMSGDQPSRVSRKFYEMYCPSAYAQHGTQPIYIGNSITDYFATLDGAIDMYDKLTCPKEFAWAPNRYHADTARKEYNGSGAYMWQFQGGGPKTSSVLGGAFEARNGKLLYKYFVDAQETLTRTEVLYSYGNPGHWTGRTWHRAPATFDPRDGYVAEIPVYDPAVPVYVVGQIEGPVTKCAGACPRVYIPKDGGIPTPTAVFPTTLLDFEDQSDLYFGSGEPTFVNDSSEGQYSASVKPFEDGTIHLMNIEPFLWKDAKELHFALKGDGKPGPVYLYLMRDSDYYFDREIFKGRYSTLTVVGEKETFDAAWHEYSIPLDKIRDRNRVDAMWFSFPSGSDRKLMIDAVHLEPANTLSAVHDSPPVGDGAPATTPNTANTNPSASTPNPNGAGNVKSPEVKTPEVKTPAVKAVPPAKWAIKLNGTKLTPSDVVPNGGVNLGDTALTLTGGRITLTDARQKALDTQLADKPLTMFLTVEDNGGPDSTVFTFGDLRLTMKDKGWYLVYNPTGSWNQVDLGVVKQGTPVHIALVAQEGLARIFLESKEIGKFPFSPTGKQLLTLGSPQAEATAFKGQIRDLDIVPQALTTELIAKRFDAGTVTAPVPQNSGPTQTQTAPPKQDPTPPKTNPNPPATGEQTKSVTVQVVLVDSSKVPEPSSILPYRHALVTQEYKIVSVTNGNMKGVTAGATIRVARWGIVGGKKTDLTTMKKGDKVSLTLGSFDDNPTLQHMFTVDDLESNYTAPYLLDTGTAAPGG